MTAKTMDDAAGAAGADGMALPEWLQPWPRTLLAPPALEKELAQLAAEQTAVSPGRQAPVRAFGGDEAGRGDMTIKRLAELDEHDHRLEQRMAELRDELAAVQRETVSAAHFQRAVALFDPVWDLLDARTRPGVGGPISRPPTPAPATTSVKA